MTAGLALAATRCRLNRSPSKSDAAAETCRARLATMVLFLAMISLAGCEAFSSNDSVATIGADLTMYAVEGDEIRIAATAEQEMVVANIGLPPIHRLRNCRL